MYYTSMSMEQQKIRRQYNKSLVEVQKLLAMLEGVKDLDPIQRNRTTQELRQISRALHKGCIIKLKIVPKQQEFKKKFKRK